MNESDVIFNLRLSNLKLDEELRLYRNGTTPENLLELIREKDAEIYELRKQASFAHDKLRRISKTSTEVVAKNDLLVKENNALLLEREQLKQNVHTTFDAKREAYEHKLKDARTEMECLKEEILALQKENETLNISMDMLIPEAEQFQAQIERLEEDASHRDTSIEKLHKRCHNLVVNNKEKYSSLEERVKSLTNDIRTKNEQLQRMSDELEKAQHFNASIKDMLAAEKKKSATLSTKLMAALANNASSAPLVAQRSENVDLVPKGSKFQPCVADVVSGSDAHFADSKALNKSGASSKRDGKNRGGLGHGLKQRDANVVDPFTCNPRAQVL
jgi:chromosome segregation ATPase